MACVSRGACLPGVGLEDWMTYDEIDEEKTVKP